MSSSRECISGSKNKREGSSQKDIIKSFPAWVNTSGIKMLLADNQMEQCHENEEIHMTLKWQSMQWIFRSRATTTRYNVSKSGVKLKRPIFH